MVGPTNDRISDPSILGQESCRPLNEFVVAVQLGSSLAVLFINPIRVDLWNTIAEIE